MFKTTLQLSALVIGTALIGSIAFISAPAHAEDTNVLGKASTETITTYEDVIIEEGKIITSVKTAKDTAAPVQKVKKGKRVYVKEIGAYVRIVDDPSDMAVHSSINNSTNYNYDVVVGKDSNGDDTVVVVKPEDTYFKEESVEIIR